jgi:hypothetical protein
MRMLLLLALARECMHYLYIVKVRTQAIEISKTSPKSCASRTP